MTKQEQKRQRLEGFTADEILYADDTICVTKQGAAMNRLVQAIEEEGAKYGLKLNHTKCEDLVYGKEADIWYRDRTQIPRKNEVKYSGVLINDKADTNKDITAKNSECNNIFNLLKITHSQTNRQNSSY